MSKHRKFSVEEKWSILQEGEQQGVTATCRKYNVAPSLFYKWKDKADLQGKAGLARGMLVVNAEVKRLKQENEMLKKLLAEKEMGLYIKEELLKKVRQRGQNGC